MVALSRPALVSFGLMGLAGPIGTCRHNGIMNQSGKVRRVLVTWWDSLTSPAGAENGSVIDSSPLYLPLFTSLVTSVPLGFVTVTGIERGFGRYLWRAEPRGVSSYKDMVTCLSRGRRGKLTHKFEVVSIWRKQEEVRDEDRFHSLLMVLESGIVALFELRG